MIKAIISALKKIFRKEDNVLIDMNKVNKKLSMSMAGDGNCSDSC